MPQDCSMYEKIHQKALDSKSTMSSGGKGGWANESHYQLGGIDQTWDIKYAFNGTEK